MHRPRVVAQRLLREPLRESAFQPRAVRPVENLRESLHCENYSSLRSMTPLRFPTGLTAPQHLTETAESCHYREKDRGPSVAIFRRLRAELKPQPCREHTVRLFVFADFTPAITPPFAAHWSDTESRIRSEIKNRASVCSLPFRHCHCFSFR